MAVGMRWRALAACAFALLFYAAFMLAKHAPGLRDAIPFGDDPYDAVGSFGAIAAVLLAALSLARAFRGGGWDAGRARRLLRTQTAIVLCAAITVLGDLVAMAREPARWWAAPARGELVALLVAVLVAAAAMQLAIRAGRPSAPPAPAPRRWRALAPLGAFAIVLAVYPVRLVQLTWTHLATVVAGAVLLFAPMPALLEALVPDPPGAAAGEEAARPARAGGRGRWWIMAAIGVGVGAFAFAGEMTEGAGGAPAARLAAVAAVFVGLATSGILVAYAFLRGPLGLGAGPDGH